MSWMVHGKIYLFSWLSCSVAKHPFSETRPMKIGGSRREFRRGKVHQASTWRHVHLHALACQGLILRLNPSSELLPENSRHFLAWVPPDGRFLLRCVSLLRESLFNSPFASRFQDSGGVRRLELARRRQVKFQSPLETRAMLFLGICRTPLFPSAIPCLL